jgi:hypothetical protein
VTRPGELRQRARSWWLAAWPCWALLIFACLAVVRLLPAGYARAVLAAPILFLVPGSLTLGAVFGERRPRGTAFVCLAALLSAIWAAFTSLALYVIKVLITADSTYWGLLIVSAGLAIVAQERLRRARRPETADWHLTTVPARRSSEADDPGVSVPARERGHFYVVAAAVFGLALLGCGVYAEDHLSHPAPVGYTWMAWTGARIERPVPVGPRGRKLSFQIVHRQPGTTTFTLKATWLSSSHSHLLARPMTLRIGPDRTVRGALFVPPLHDGCIYRIVLAMTARQIDPLTKRRQQWFINADIREQGKSVKACSK